MSYRKRTRDEHFFDEGPKRILCLDGGGLRGSHALGVLQKMEDLLRSRHGGDPDFRLADYFDLIAGTSTGAIIAAMLARGDPVAEIYKYYRDMGREVFKKTFLGGATLGLVRSKYDKEVLATYLQDAVGAETRLGDDSVKTGLLILAKRINTHSLWALGNNPEGRFFSAPQDPKKPPGVKKWAPNGEYLLWKLLRASAAAPTYFDPVEVDVGDPKTGHFIDGGMSPFNDPSLQALMYATMTGYGVGWSASADKMLIVSVGTGSFLPPAAEEEKGGALKRLLLRLVKPGASVQKAFFSLLHDNQDLTRTMMQWVSSSPTADERDLEMGDLTKDHLGGQPLLSYLRFDTELKEDGLRPLMPYLASTLKGRDIDPELLTRMDEPANVELLYHIGNATANLTMKDEHFDPCFDIEASSTRSAFRVGVVGHRDNILRFEDTDELTERVAAILGRIARMVPKLSVVSALAEGADRIGARVARKAGYDLICPLPFDRDCYKKDFTPGESRLEFAELLDVAVDVRELHGDRDDEPGAYAAVGRAVLRRSELLVAIWDGESARGRGGTAEVVEEAAARMPVVWIHSDPSVASCLLTVDENGVRATRPDSGLEAEVAAILSG